ncbi:hypothetical protein I551_0167 [Mycobacterium ulcerans str. Harvey]|uniref:Uncharacterized protein n=1 Tax=Mycobacterium ulcerans str. Harvey TaxID=1299332 RepID=A0ABP3AU19_MYCUL|nr:hypothetical protein I551_0167 [Mycobacterium ulcerans str. Harvey]
MLGGVLEDTGATSDSSMTCATIRSKAASPCQGARGYLRGPIHPVIRVDQRAQQRCNKSQDVVDVGVDQTGHPQNERLAGDALQDGAGHRGTQPGVGGVDGGRYRVHALRGDVPAQDVSGVFAGHAGAQQHGHGAIGIGGPGSKHGACVVFGRLPRVVGAQFGHRDVPMHGFVKQRLLGAEVFDDRGLVHARSGGDAPYRGAFVADLGEDSATAIATASAAAAERGLDHGHLRCGRCHCLRRIRRQVQHGDGQWITARPARAAPPGLRAGHPPGGGSGCGTVHPGVCPAAIWRWDARS